jgi:hypothetical protein
MARKNALTWKEVVNNVLLKLVSTGQVALVAFIGLLALMVYRTPADNIVDVWHVLAQMIERRSGLGYSLAAVCAGGWVAHTRWQRRKTERELERVVKERNDAQQKLFAKRLESSKRQ